MSYAYAGNYETGTNAYKAEFVDYMRKKAPSGPEKGYNSAAGYMLPEATHSAFSKAICRKNPFRRIATVKAAYGNGYTIHAKFNDDYADWVQEGGNIPIYDGIDDFTELAVGSHKLCSFTKLSEEFAHDASFDIEEYLVDRFSGNFARSEEAAFVNGNGTDRPTGILHATAGAQTGLTSERSTAVTFNEIISLFFTVKPEYRTGAVWLMNDETATALRLLKDGDGQYIWNHTNDTILGRPIIISNAMPSMEAGNKPIAFGDFSYYWIVDRKPIHISTLTEKFALNGQIAYLAKEFLDGKLVRREAIKVIQMKAAE